MEHEKKERAAKRPRIRGHDRHSIPSHQQLHLMKEETVDTVILGAGPSGIAAARFLLEHEHSGNKFVVLEGRSRVGGRAFSDSTLGYKMDHGARWIHGACPDNPMVMHLQNLHHRDTSKKSSSTAQAEESPRQGDQDLKTPPPFAMNDNDEILTEYEIGYMDNSKQLHHRTTTTRVCTKLLSPRSSDKATIVSRNVSGLAKGVAKKIFENAIQPAMDHPRDIFAKYGVDSNLETLSFLDLLLLQYSIDIESTTTLTEVEKRLSFDHICQERIIAENEEYQSLVNSCNDERDKEGLFQEVLAYFRLLLYTTFDSWEGAPLHKISALHGMEVSCLPGENALVVPFGYGGLIQQLARPLLEPNLIRLEHNVLSIQTHREESSAGQTRKEKVSVTYQLSNGVIGIIHALACIVALPLGVLKASVSNAEGSITFVPRLPATIEKSILSLGIAVREKIELLFPFRWWTKDIGRFYLANTHLQQSATFNPYATFIEEKITDERGILVCYVAGEFAVEMNQKSDATIQEECMQVLRQADIAERDHIPDPIAVNVTRWFKDPFSLGSWTFFGKGSCPQDLQEFRSNTECAERGLFFAGEHTCGRSSVRGDDMGCVHGAWVSGELAAKAVLDIIQNKNSAA